MFVLQAHHSRVDEARAGICRRSCRGPCKRQRRKAVEGIRGVERAFRKDIRLERERGFRPRGKRRRRKGKGRRQEIVPPTKQRYVSVPQASGRKVRRLFCI